MTALVPHVDNAWEKIVTWILTDPDAAVSNAKVSGSRGPSHTICVYTTNYRNEQELSLVRQQLRQQGFKAKLYYKAYVYTLNIHSANKWRLPDGVTL